MVLRVGYSHASSSLQRGRSSRRGASRSRRSPAAVSDFPCGRAQTENTHQKFSYVGVLSYCPAQGRLDNKDATKHVKGRKERWTKAKCSLLFGAMLTNSYQGSVVKRADGCPTG